MSLRILSPVAKGIPRLTCREDGDDEAEILEEDDDGPERLLIECTNQQCACHFACPADLLSRVTGKTMVAMFESGSPYPFRHVFYPLGLLPGSPTRACREPPVPEIEECERDYGVLQNHAEDLSQIFPRNDCYSHESKSSPLSCLRLSQNPPSYLAPDSAMSNTFAPCITPYKTFVHFSILRYHGSCPAPSGIFPFK